MASLDAASARRRLPAIDAAHFSWDLAFFGFIGADVAGGLGWRIFARLIAGSFLFLVGVGLVLATRGGFNRGRYFRRLTFVAAGALAITVVTWFVFPDAYVFFGILHAIAVSSVLGLVFVRAPILLIVVAAIFCFVAPQLLSAPIFNLPALLWLGLFTESPRSNDFVPILPWFGVVLAGIAAARLAPHLPLDGISKRLDAAAPQPLVWAGRYSLIIYLLHQPLLFGLTYLAVQVAPPGHAAFERQFVRACARNCAAAELDENLCERTCLCLAERGGAEGLWGGPQSEAEERRYLELVGECRTAAESE
jgi:uncharacterized membrane protein